MKIFVFSLAFLLTLISDSFSCVGNFPHNGLNMIKNHHYKNQASPFRKLQIKEITEDIIEIYKPIFGKENKKLTIDIDWNRSNINAYTTRDDHNNPVIKMTGGLAADKTLSIDGLTLILCHEIGHHLGGEPKKLRGRSTKKDWASAEGQADYYATAFCMKKVLQSKKYQENSQDSDEAKFHNFSPKDHSEIKEICKNKLCKKIAYATLSLAKYYAKLDLFSRDLSLIDKDYLEVFTTNYKYPNPQCRLDSMVAGLLCPSSLSLKWEKEKLESSECQDKRFQRPLCWFAQKSE